MKRRAFLALGVETLRRLLAADTSSEPIPGGRTYRVDAKILFLSIPVYTRANVGNGYARYVLTQGSGGTTHVLEFAAGSFPERARGLNRLGMIRERVAEAGGATEAHYVGFMTASREESLSEAKSALNNAASSGNFVAIEGENKPGEVRTRRAQFAGDARIDSERWMRLQSQAEAALRASDWASTGHKTPSTFLFVVLQAIRSGEGALKHNYAYGRDRYELTTVKKPDAATGRKLQAKGVTNRPDSIYSVSGNIRNLRTGYRTTFRIWTEKNAPVPLRIEYQPKSYLVLALEAERRAAG